MASYYGWAPPLEIIPNSQPIPRSPEDQRQAIERGIDMVCEPCDWAFTLNRWRHVGMASPVLPASAARKLGEAVSGTKLGRIGSEDTLLYRAVSQAEYDNLMLTNQFSVGPNSMESKFFAENANDAARWGDRLEGPGKYRIIEVELSNSIADNLMRREKLKLDNIGPARYAELYQLENATIRGIK